MYNADAVRRRIAKYGLQETIRLLASDKLSEEAKAELEECNILIGGYPCISVLQSL